MNGSKASYLTVALVSCAVTWTFIWWLGANENEMLVPYADFEREIAAGKVDQVRIDGTEYHYRLAHDTTRRKTTGPRATLSSIVDLHGPPEAPPPKVFCER